MNAAKSLVISTVALLLAGAAQAQTVQPRYDSETYKPVFKGSMTPGADGPDDSLTGSQANSRRLVGEPFPGAKKAERKLAGEALVDRPNYRVDTYKSVFNAGMVGSSGEIQLEAPSAGPSAGEAAIPHGKSPTAHANEMAELFRQACLLSLSDGQSDRVADWALSQGYVSVRNGETRREIKQLTQGAQSLNIFARDTSETSPLLVFTSRPLQCGVIARQEVDAPRLRAQLARLAVQWSGTPAPRAMLLEELNGTETSVDGRLLAYRFNTNGQRQTLATLSPRSAKSDAPFLAVRIGEGAGR
jgi:hypothetical protein